MTRSALRRDNLGRLILAARAMADLTRVQLAKAACLAHATLKLAEEGDSSVPEESLVKICRALEQRGFEFLDGTRTASIALHNSSEEADQAGVTADGSMPGLVRRIYPRRLDARSLVGDLEACGVLIENAERLLDLCGTEAAPWGDTFMRLVREGRKFGIRFRWRGSVPNVDGVQRVVAIYDFPPDSQAAILNNIQP